MGFFAASAPAHRPTDEDGGPWAQTAFDGHAIPGQVPSPIVVADAGDAVVVATLAVGEGLLRIDWQAINRGSPRRTARDQYLDYVLEPGESLPDGYLRLGVAYADGRRATNLPWDRWRSADGPADALTWSERGGSSDPHVRRISITVGPAPVSGDLRLVCEWPALGLPETSASVPADVLARARALEVVVPPHAGA